MTKIRGALATEGYRCVQEDCGRAVLPRYGELTCEAPETVYVSGTFDIGRKYLQNLALPR